MLAPWGEFVVVLKAAQVSDVGYQNSPVLCISTFFSFFFGA